MISVEFFEEKGDSVVDWLVKLFVICVMQVEVPEEW